MSQHCSNNWPGCWISNSPSVIMMLIPQKWVLPHATCLHTHTHTHTCIPTCKPVRYPGYFREPMEIQRGSWNYRGWPRHVCTFKGHPHIKLCTVRYRYSMAKFLQYTVNKHPIIACPWGPGMLYPLWFFLFCFIPWPPLCCIYNAI